MIDDKTEIFLRIYDGQSFILVDVNHLRPEQIQINGIASALSKLCRYGGNLREHYSVAQHSVIVSRMLNFYAPEIAMWGLLHDAAEAFIVDMVSPLKKQLSDYQTLESRVADAVASKFGLPTREPWQVHKADQLIGQIERSCMQGVQDPNGYVRLYGEIKPGGALAAEIMFLERYVELKKMI